MMCAYRYLRCGIVLLLVIMWASHISVAYAEEVKEQRWEENVHFYGLVIDPAAMYVGASASVRFMTSPKPRTPKTAHLELEQLSVTGGPSKPLGIMNDQGQEGDIQAGDGTYSLQMIFQEYEVGRVPVRVKWQQENGPVYSNTEFFEVSPVQFPLTVATSDRTRVTRDPDSGDEMVYDEVLVVFQEGTSYDRIETIIGDINGIVIGRLPRLSFWQIRLPWSSGANDVKEAIRRLKAHREVREADPNRVMKTQ